MKSKYLLLIVLIICLLIAACSKKSPNDPGEQNAAPTASFTFTPAGGTTSTDFQFDASGCSDAQDAVSALQVRWDFENNGAWAGYTTTKTATHRYSTAGTKTVKLEVMDSGGLTDWTRGQVTVSDNSGGTIELQWTAVAGGTFDMGDGYPDE